MKQILIATHGKMASGIRYTAEMIAGKSEEITTIDAYVNQEDDLEKQLKDYFETHKNDRIIVFTDIMGGSVNQKLMAYADLENVTLITGINLPVLVQVMFAGEDIAEKELEDYVKEAQKEMQIVHTVVKEETQENSVQKTKTDLEQYEQSEAGIAALRIDDRLIHGQVAMTWTKHLRVQGIVVACDEAAADNTQKMALKMAVPQGIKVLIKSVDEAIRVLNNPKAAGMRILVLTRTVRDALKVREHIGKVEFFNIGNVGRFDGIDMSEKKALTETIMLTESERQSLRKIVALEPNVCIQQVPNDEQKLVKSMLEKWDS